jgi:hypothetical protein
MIRGRSGVVESPSSKMPPGHAHYPAEVGKSGSRGLPPRSSGNDKIQHLVAVRRFDRDRVSRFGIGSAIIQRAAHRTWGVSPISAGDFRSTQRQVLAPAKTVSGTRSNRQRFSWR